MRCLVRPCMIFIKLRCKRRYTIKNEDSMWLKSGNATLSKSWNKTNFGGHTNAARLFHECEEDENMMM